MSFQIFAHCMVIAAIIAVATIAIIDQIRVLREIDKEILAIDNLLSSRSKSLSLSQAETKSNFEMPG